MWTAPEATARTKRKRSDVTRRAKQSKRSKRSKRKRAVERSPKAKKARRSARRSRRKQARGNVLIIGSSSINGSFGKRVEKRLAARGFKVFRKGRSSAGLARPDFFDWEREISGLPIDKNTRGAVVYLGTNDGQAIWLRPSDRARLKRRAKWLRWGDKHWDRIYQRRVTSFAKALCKAGVWRVAFVTPVDTTKKTLEAKLNVIRRLQYRGARRSRCAWAYSGRGDRRRLRREKPDMPSSRRLRYQDGFHMTNLGADVVWDRVEKRLVRYFKRRMPKRLRKPRKRSRRSKRRARRLARSKRTARPGPG